MSLPARSPKLFTLTALYDATSELLGVVDPDDESNFHAEAVDRVAEFWTAVSKAIPEWMQVKNGMIRSIDLRQEKISAHSVVLRSIGAAGHQLIAERPHGWKAGLLDLTQIDWKKDNPDWENVCIVAHSVVSNRQARVATRAYIKEKLGLNLTEVESRSRTRSVNEDGAGERPERRAG